VAEARQIDPTAKYRPIEAVLARYENGPSAGINFIGAPTNIEEWSVCLHFLLELGDAESVLTQIASPPAGLQRSVEFVWPPAISTSSREMLSDW
jgi:hypothetical protein